ncbi:MAG: Cys-tRNA(Pro) deacylase [Bacteroidaceae bacterium]|nr:Cys-tRNA(Pro) deacylase [Bacteroidaceae bacterium]
MAKNNDKTNVCRVLDSKKIEYKLHTYEADPTLTGEDIAGILGEDADKVFKTLVTQGKTGAYYVCVVPVKCELDLKKAASAAGEKSVAMIKQKELLPLTGYVHGGCSPIGMKKPLPTWFHQTLTDYDTVFCSAGQRGLQFRLAPNDLLRAAKGTLADLIV